MQRSAISSVRATASGYAAEVLLHLLRGLEEELVRVEAPMVRVGERVSGLDAEKRLVGARILVAQIVDVTCRDERKSSRDGDLRKLGVDLRLHLEPGVLDLEVRRVTAENVVSGA